MKFVLYNQTIVSNLCFKQGMIIQLGENKWVIKRLDLKELLKV